MTDTVDAGPAAETPAVDQVIIRFAGDSGDGMQLTGDRFTTASVQGPCSTGINWA